MSSLKSRIASRLTRRQWGLAIGLTSQLSLAADGLQPLLDRLDRRYPRRDHLWADPFTIRWQGARYVFCEEMVYGAGRGRIVAFEIDHEGTWSVPTTVIEADYHLSYPFVFSWGDRLYLLPESAEAGRFEIHRSTRPPAEWVLEKTFQLDCPGVDPTLFTTGGDWWLFTGAYVGEAVTVNRRLHLYRASSPLGPWEPHPENPVATGPAGSRPAGGVFRHEGSLYRPGQDCRESYGSGVILHRIERLTPQEYRETPVGRVGPDPSRDEIALHTINFDGQTLVADVARSRLRWPWEQTAAVTLQGRPERSAIA